MLACVQASDLKKRIESLIDREYLARDAADPNVSAMRLHDHVMQSAQSWRVGWLGSGNGSGLMTGPVA